MSDDHDPALRKKFADIGVRYLVRTQSEVGELRAHAERLRAGEPAALKEIELLAHRIRGSGAVFGFHGVSDAAGVIEKLAMQGAREGAADTAQIGAQAVELVAALADAVQSAQQVGPAK